MQNKNTLKRYTSLFIFFIATVAFAQERPVLDIMLTNYQYPFNVNHYNFNSQNQDVKMAYMDIQPQNASGKTIVLLHGKNFNGAYWKTTIQALTEDGHRVVVPDQIGFGKSTKPVGYQFSFQQLAKNTKQLLDELKIEKVIILGHSMGGMLATRFTLMYPELVEKIILENPIGLEDWKIVVPYVSIDQHFQNELNASYEKVKAYQLEFYYDNIWNPAYDEWVYLLTGWTKHPEYRLVAWNNAQTSEMIFTQPVVYEFQYIQVPSLLIIGTRDRTAIGKKNVKDEVEREEMGRYDKLGKITQNKIPNSKLVELENVGHLPHIESFERFMKPLKDFIEE